MREGELDGLDESVDELDNDAEPWNVYFLSLIDPAAPSHDFERVKVGYTKHDVERRIEQLQTGNPYQLRCEKSFIAPAPVARLIEHWVHRANAVHVIQGEWLRLARHEIPGLAESAQRERERFAAIVEARTRWSQAVSNRTERQAGTEELKLHEEARDVASKLSSIKLRRRHIQASIALCAGRVLCVPGIFRITVQPPKTRFNPQEVKRRFWDLATGCGAVERVGGTFRWRGVPTIGSPEWSAILSEVKSLERRRKALDMTFIRNPHDFRDVGERTEEIAHLHDNYLLLTQELERFTLDDAVLKAQMIRSMEHSAGITAVCGFPRSPKRVLDRKAKNSFCDAHRIEAAQCVSKVEAFVQRRLYKSRSY